MEIVIRQANLSDLSEVSRLFNEYRMFYGQHSDLEACTCFIQERIRNNESLIFIAEWKEQRRETLAAATAIDEKERESAITTVGLVQIYPSFSSVSMGPIWIINDLYVDSYYRQQGIGRKLMQAVMKQANEHQILRITLSTGLSNERAQALYTSEGYTQDLSFMYYECNV